MGSSKGKNLKWNRAISRVKAVSYLAELYKTAGNGIPVLPSVFTETVCDICADNFCKKDGKWYWVNGYFGESVETIKAIHIDESVVHQGKGRTFKEVSEFVKWDLIHQKLVELNKAEAA